jgi:hypothetical protein
MISLVIIVILVWTLASVVDFAKNIGRKHSNGKPTPWYKWVLAFPMLAIATIGGILLHPKATLKYYRNKFSKKYK